MTEKENALLIFEHKMPEWLPRFEYCISAYFPENINERPAVHEDDDWFGVHWVPDINIGLTAPSLENVVIKNIENWKNELVFPDLESIDWDKEAELFRKQVPEDTLSMIIMEMGIFERYQLLLGFEDSLFSFYDYPNEAEEILEALTQFKLNLVEKIARYIKPDVIMYMDDLGTQKGPLISPGTWEEFIKEKDTRIFNSIKNHGIKVIYHCCGKIDTIFDKIIDMHPDAYHSVQPTNDVKYLKETYNDKIVFVGGIDNQGVTNKPDVTEEEIRAEVHRAIDLLAPGGSYICGDTDGVCLIESSLKIIQDEYEKYGRNYYQRNK